VQLRDELEKINSCKTLVYKPEDKKPFGRNGRCWEDIETMVV
jgi:hypothetical protein